MQVEDIINIWMKEGWVNAQAYGAKLDEWRRKPIPELDADFINPKVFWKATDVHFGTDTVCNSTLDNIKRDRKESNKANHNIASFSGALGYMDLAIFNIKQRSSEINIAEIGCGYGSFKENYIDNNKDVDSYIGFDLLKREDWVQEVEGYDGTFSDDQVEELKGKINIFYSCNVFQHLSTLKIGKYLSQVYDILPKGGYMVLVYVKGEAAYHYGQFIEIMPKDVLEEFVEDLGFDIESISEQRIKNNRTFNTITYLLKKK